MEVINLENENSECFKPKDSPLSSYSVGLFMQDKAMICEEYSSSDCYLYDSAQGNKVQYNVMREGICYSILLNF